MRGRKMNIQWEHDEATLKELYMKEQDPHLRIRFHALWLLRRGYRLAQTAEVLGVHIRTVQRWLCWYRQGGIEALRSHRQGGKGRKPYLSPHQISMLCDRASEAVDWVWEQFGVHYTYWGMRSLFRRLALTYFFQGIPSSPAVLEKGGLREALRERGVQPNQRIFWADEMRVGLHGRVARLWKVRQRVQIEYKWKYLALAVDVGGGEIYYQWIDSLKGADVAKAVRFWKGEGVEVIVWDRARSHRSLEVREVGLELIEQPPYSPELNPSERIFEEIRRRVEGRVYQDLDKKCEREYTKFLPTTPFVYFFAKNLFPRYGQGIQYVKRLPTSTAPPSSPPRTLLP